MRRRKGLYGRAATLISFRDSTSAAVMLLLFILSFDSVSDANPIAAAEPVQSVAVVAAAAPAPAPSSSAGVPSSGRLGDAPPAVLNEGNVEWRPCKNRNDSNCAVHVFRVALTQRPSEDSHQEVLEVPLRQMKRYGANVYAPIGAAASRSLNQQIVDNIPKDLEPDLRSTMKELIENNQYLLKESGSAVAIESTATLSSSLEPDDELPLQQPRGTLINVPRIVLQPPPLQQQPSSVSKDASSASSSSTALLPPTIDSLTFFLIVCLIAVGVCFGVALTCACLYLIEYRSKPTFDRSNVVTFRRVCDPRVKERFMAGAQPNGGGGGGGGGGRSEASGSPHNIIRYTTHMNQGPGPSSGSIASSSRTQSPHRPPHQSVMHAPPYRGRSSGRPARFMRQPGGGGGTAMEMQLLRGGGGEEESIASGHSSSRTSASGVPPPGRLPPHYLDRPAAIVTPGHQRLPPPYARPAPNDPSVYYTN